MNLRVVTSIILSIGLGVILGYTLKAIQPPLLITPSGQPRILSSTTYETDYAVIGFLPYWLLNESIYIRTELLTHLAYFGVSINEQGQIETELEDGTKELGLHRLRTSDTLDQLLTRADQTNTKKVLVIRAMSNERIASAVAPSNRTQLINQLIDIVLQHDFQGINLDFEPNQPPDDQLREQYTQFAAEISQQCRQRIPDCHMSVDVYASAASRPRIWDLPELAKHVDHIIIMGYDFHGPSSAAAGPTAPLYGSPHRWEYDLVSTVQQFYQLAEPSTYILAIPYYGYQWTTLSADPGSTALSPARTIRYNQINQLRQDCQAPDCQIKFDPDSLSPYLVTQHATNRYTQVWYDDTISLRLKYDLVKQSEFSGIAIWALGYDAPEPGLWDLIQQEFYTP